MKKFIKYILIASLFTAQNLFAENTTDAGIDISVYATWMVSVFFIVTFILVGFFLSSTAKEPILSESEAILIPEIFIKNQINISSGNSFYFLPSVSLELNKIRFLLISALIIFSVVLLLLTI